MNSSIEKRIKIIIAISLALVSLMAGVTLYYSSQVNDSIRELIGTDIKLERLGQKLKAHYYDLKGLERDHLFSLRTGNQSDPEETAARKIQVKLERFKEVIENYRKEIEKKGFKLSLSVLKQEAETYGQLIADSTLSQTSWTGSSVYRLAKTLGKQREKIDESINIILSKGTNRSLKNQKQIDKMISDVSRNLVLLLAIALFSGLLIIYLAPQNVTKPIRSYANAVRELRDLKFETRLPIRGKNELTMLGEEINKFVESFVAFDGMKRKKIQFEKRKFQVLSDMLNLGVVVISIEGEVMFLNAQMARFFNLSTESFQKKDFHFVRLPEEMKDLFEDALKKLEKFENRMIILSYQKTDENGEKQDEAVELLADAAVVRNYVGDVANIILTFEDISDQPQDSIFKRVSFC